MAHVFLRYVSWIEVSALRVDEVSDQLVQAESHRYLGAMSRIHRRQLYFLLSDATCIDPWRVRSEVLSSLSFTSSCCGRLSTR